MTDTTTAAEAAAQTEAERAAEEALARAGRPPGTLGIGRVEEHEEFAEAGDALQPDSRDEPPEPRTGAQRFAERLADQREQHGEGDVVAVSDEYLEARDRVADGEGDEADLERVQEWLLSDESEVNTRELKVRLGGSDKNPLIASWWIRAIGIDVIRSAEREAAGANRAQRRGEPQYDELKANLRIVVEGTLAIGGHPHDPNAMDCKAAAKAKGLRDPTSWLQRRFQYRPGTIARIAGEIMALSGFDQEDVRAAGN